MSFRRLFVTAMLLGLAATTGAQAKGDTLTLRVKSDDGQIRFFHHGKRLTEPTLERLCATARSQKADIEFEREKMTGSDALAAILKEADCLGAKRMAASERRPDPEPSARTHARHRHTKGKPQ